MNRSQKNTSQNNGLCLDANVLLEIVLARPNELIARQILEDHQSNLCISALTAHLVVHFGVERTSLDILAEFLADYTILPLNDYDLDWAFENCRDEDFEDALQLAVAMHGGCQKFVTFDKKLLKNYQDLSSIKIELAK